MWYNETDSLNYLFYYFIYRWKWVIVLQKKRVKGASAKGGKSAANSKGSKSNRNSKKTNVAQVNNVDHSQRNYELLGIFLVAVGLISLLGMIDFNVGFVGIYFSKFLSYFFGLGAPAFAIAFMGIGGYFIMKHQKLTYNARFFGAVGIGVFALAMVHHFFVRPGAEILPESLTSGGGLLGGMVLFILRKVLGVDGAVIMIGAGLLGAILVATTWSLAKGILFTKEKAEKGADAAKDAAVVVYDKSKEVGGRVTESVGVAMAGVKENLADVGEKLKGLKGKQFLEKYEQESGFLRDEDKSVLPVEEMAGEEVKPIIPVDNSINDNIPAAEAAKDNQDVNPFANLEAAIPPVEMPKAEMPEVEPVPMGAGNNDGTADAGSANSSINADNLNGVIISEDLLQGNTNYDGSGQDIQPIIGNNNRQEDMIKPVEKGNNIGNAGVIQPIAGVNGMADNTTQAAGAGDDRFAPPPQNADELVGNNPAAAEFFGETFVNTTPTATIRGKNIAVERPMTASMRKLQAMNAAGQADSDEAPAVVGTGTEASSAVMGADALPDNNASVNDEILSDISIENTENGSNLTAEELEALLALDGLNHGDFAPETKSEPDDTVHDEIPEAGVAEPADMSPVFNFAEDNVADEPEAVSEVEMAEPDHDYGIESMTITSNEAALDMTENLPEADEADIDADIDDMLEETVANALQTSGSAVVTGAVKAGVTAGANQAGNVAAVQNAGDPGNLNIRHNSTNGNGNGNGNGNNTANSAVGINAGEVKAEELKPIPPYEVPSIMLLNKTTKTINEELKQEISDNAKILGATLADFKVKASILNACHGPAVTRYEVKPAPGVKVSKITGLADDIALNMAATAVRIEQIPGKAAIGIEIPNKELESVQLREVLEKPAFAAAKSRLTVGLGKDISGQAIFADLAKMPHLLVAGATGSGKSVCINTLITSILFKAKPNEVKFILIDPKMVELSVYNDIPHLMVPVVTDARKAASVLNWAVQEMEKRYGLIAQMGVRNMESYNKAFSDVPEKQLPSIVIIIDELADLMMVAPHDVEDAICRIAQKARAAGIYLVLATQRPSVNVITGVIKANIPSRISFAVTSQIASRTILDAAGAEKLLGKGDMLFKPQEANKATRIQGAFVSDEEVELLVETIKAQGVKLEANQEIIDFTNKAAEEAAGEEDGNKGNKGKIDSLLREAVELVMSTNIASASSFQRRYHIGYSRAGRLLDTMEQLGIVGPPQGSKPREILVTESQAFEIMDNYESEE